MNRTSFLARFWSIAPLVMIAALLCPAPSWAQYMYLDANGDGVHTDADILNPTGSTHVSVWVVTNHNRDGSLQTCNSHTGAPHSWDTSSPDPGLDIFSYDIYLVVTHGTVVWGDFDDAIGFKKLPNDAYNTRTDTQIHITRFADLGEEKPAGRYKLGSMSVSVGAGTPSIFFSPMIGWDYSSFGTHCSASGEFPNSYVYGVDWFDADGILYGGTINHEPSFGQPGPIRVVENRTADLALTATDEDGQSLSFTKLSGPDYVTVSTTDPGSGQGSGVVRAAPQSSDVGGANVVVRVSDGVFWCDRTIPVAVKRELELNAQGNVSMVAGQVQYQELYADNPLNQDVQYYIASGPSFVGIDSRNYGIRTRMSPTVQDIGTWSVTLGVTNGTIRNEKSFTVEVLRNGENHLPVAIAGGPLLGVVGRPVLFDGSHSSDPDGDRLTYVWSFGDGAGMAGPSVEHRYSIDGDYTVDLTVHDPERFAVGTTTAHIVPVAPARAYIVGGMSAVFAGTREVDLRVEPVDQAFASGEVSAANASSIRLTSALGGEIAAIGCDAGDVLDADRDGIPDCGILFAAEDVARLLGAYQGRGVVELTLRGELSGGGRFSAPVMMRIVRHGGKLSAGISPNPLNPAGRLSFVTARPGTADVKIFDVSGRLAHHAIDHGTLPAGYHEVSVGRGERGEALPSGIYYYRIETPEAVARGRFAIVR